MDPNVAQQHDDVYAAVFSLVGQKPNETYEGLAKVLPSIKDTDPAELKELEARKALSDMMKPSVDPLRLEYERAAAKEDVDDLSTEDGEWLDVSKQDDDAQELDENGIPILKLSRASSSFILDGPGDVKVDNFTPEVDLLADEDGDPPAGGAAAGEPQNRGAAAATPASTSNTSYVPSAIARAKRPSGAGGASASDTSANVTTDGASVPVVPGSGPAAAAAAGAAAAAAAATVRAATPPVMTLEDEIRAMRASAGRQGAPSAADPTSHSGDQSPHSHPQRQEPRLPEQEEEDEDAPEVLPEPSGTLLPPGGGRRRSGSGLATPPGAVIGDGGDDDEESMATRIRSGLGADEQPVPSLPGTCQDTRAEDALWAMIQGVNGRALVEHLGLAAREDEKGEGQQATAGTTDQLPQSGAAVTSVLANGHLHDDAAAHGQLKEGAPLDSASCPPFDSASSANGLADGGGVAELEHENSVAAVVAANAGSVGAAHLAGAANSNGAAPADRGSTAAVMANGHRSQPSTRLQPLASASSEGPTFEAVESFSLDPDFDYDNVTLTVRDFPYSLLNFPIRR